MLKHFTPTSRFLWLAKLVILAVPMVLLAWLLNQRFIFTPTITFTYRAGTKPGALLPATNDIVRAFNSGWRVDADVLGVKVRIPRLVESIRFRSILLNRTQPIIKLRAIGNQDYGDQVRFIRHRVLDELPWNRLENGLLHLWQRPEREIIEPTTNADGGVTDTVVGREPVKQFDSVENFLTNLPAASQFAVLDLDPMLFAVAPNYQPALAPITIAHAFRGSHGLYVYAANEDLRISFDKVDLNRNVGKDEMVVSIRRISLDPNERTLIDQVQVADDGNTGSDNQHGQPQRVEVIATGLPPGMYKIDIKASDDVVWRNILSYQHILVFADRVFFSDSPVQGGPEFRPLRLFTHGPSLQFSTKHPEGLQTIRSAGREISLDRIGPKAVLDSLPNQSEVALDRGDIIVEGPGLIAISPAKLPEPVPASLIASGTADLQSFDYIIGRYFPKPAFGRVNIDENFPLRRLLLTTNDLHFQLEFPGLRGSRRVVEIRTISATLRRGAFPWNKLPDKIQSIFHSPK